MVIVSGTGRSGTSMWMQVFNAAGFPVVGESFPQDWRERLGAANARGFFESTLTGGINFTTNPDPRTGARLDPATSGGWVAKVFTHGVRRTDRAFLGRVLVSVRGWRAFARSVGRLQAMERAAGASVEAQRPTELALWWFREHVETLQDAARRGYDARFLAYESILADPEGTVADVLEWVGLPCDVPAGISAVAPALRTQDPVDTPPDLPLAWVEVFDELYASLTEGRPPTPGSAGRLACTYEGVVARLGIGRQ